MAIMKLLDLAREIMQAIIDTQGEWINPETLYENDEPETLELAFQMEIDRYQGYGFLYNFILFAGDHDMADAELPTVARRFYETVVNMDDDDQEELETMIRDLAIDYLATGKIM